MTNLTKENDTITYTYDSFGRKIKRVDSNGKSCYYIYDGMDCVFEIDDPLAPVGHPKESRWILRGLGVAPGVGNIIAIKTHNIIMTENPGPADPLFTEEITTDYYHSNHRGNIVFTTDESGNKKAQLRYDAFGNTTFESNASDVKYRFSSKEWDSVAQLYYYGFRWYDPEHGIWTTKDPIGLSAGDLNVYRMVFNNPVMFKDVYGYAGFAGGWQVSGSSINPFTSGGGNVNGFNRVAFSEKGFESESYKYDTNDNEHFGIGLDVGVGIESTWAYGEGPWNGTFYSLAGSHLWFSGSIFLSACKNSDGKTVISWIGFSFGLNFGLPGAAFEKTNYHKK